MRLDELVPVVDRQRPRLRERRRHPLHPGNVQARSFEPLLEEAGLLDMRFHGLRHTAATLLLGAGVHPTVVSETLGHSGVTITLTSTVT